MTQKVLWKPVYKACPMSAPPQKKKNKNKNKNTSQYVPQISPLISSTFLTFLSDNLKKRSIIGAMWSKKCEKSQFSSNYYYNTGHLFDFFDW